MTTFLSLFRAAVLKYQEGYKYRTYENYEILTPFVGMAARIEARDGGRPWVELRQDGALFIREGYAWDGASGPTIDTRSSMIPSLLHDALYQLASAGKLAVTERDRIDDWFEALCLACGMWKIRARAWRKGLSTSLAAEHFKAEPEKILVAP